MTTKKVKEKQQTIGLEEIEQFIIDAGSDHLATFGGKFEGGIHCQQVPDEMAACILAILESEQTIKAYLEIGVAAGGTAFLIDHFFKPEKIVLIDDNMHPKAYLRPHVLRDIKYKEIIGNSCLESAQKAVKSLKTLFDIILIDGDHTYMGVSEDIAIYGKFLNPGGFLILHDSALHEWGVCQAVDELKTDKNMKLVGEYITSKHNRPCGIALFRKAIIKVLGGKT